jgi:hypothetical protein
MISTGFFAELKRQNSRRLAITFAIASLLLILAATMLLALFEAEAGDRTARRSAAIGDR